MIAIERLLSGAVWIVVRWVLAGVFVYAGCVKLTHPQAFVASIARFQIAPEIFIHPIALGLPPFEVICGLALLAGPWQRPAAFGIVVLCLVFLAVLLSAAVRGIEVECSCFGSSAPEPLWIAIVRDVALLIAAIGAYLSKLLPIRSTRRELSTERTVLNGTF